MKAFNQKMWSIQNIARVALMQIGAVIANILVGGICHKFASLSELPVRLPPYENWWYHYGLFGFGLPIIWTISSLYLYSRDEISDFVKLIIYWFGIFAVVALTVMMVGALLRNL